MDMSVFDLFKVGIGPSSSHTVGPMVAARRFLLDCGPLERAAAVLVELYGSLALTGVGHGTDKAVILGLLGETPMHVNPDAVDDMLAEVELDGQLRLLGDVAVPFSARTGVVLHKTESLPEHPNGMRFTLTLDDGSSIARIYYSVGGGFIHAEGEAQVARQGAPVPYPFGTMAELLAHGPGQRLGDSRHVARQRMHPHDGQRSWMLASTISGRSCATASLTDWSPRASCPVA